MVYMIVVYDDVVSLVRRVAPNGNRLPAIGVESSIPGDLAPPYPHVMRCTCVSCANFDLHVMALQIYVLNNEILPPDGDLVSKFRLDVKARTSKEHGATRRTLAVKYLVAIPTTVNLHHTARG